MKRRYRGRPRDLAHPVTSESDFHQMLDLLVKLDRTLLEHSMTMYKVSPSDRLAMREQNRRLHDAVRGYLPRLASTADSLR